MELHAVVPQNRHLYAGELDQNHRLRAQIFVGEYGWRALNVSEGRESDQFDTPSAIYILALEPGLGVVGSVRLQSSLEPTLLSHVFPHGAERGFERAGDVYEWTRIFVVPERRHPKPCKVAGALQAATLRHCLDLGGRLMNMVTHAWYMPAMIESGLRLRALGLPFQHEDMQLVACAAPVDAEGIAALTRHYDLGSWSLLSRQAPASRPDHRLVA